VWLSNVEVAEPNTLPLALGSRSPLIVVLAILAFALTVKLALTAKSPVIEVFALISAEVAFTTLKSPPLTVRPLSTLNTLFAMATLLD
jgi:hypothetical protein